MIDFDFLRGTHSALRAPQLDLLTRWPRTTSFESSSQAKVEIPSELMVILLGEGFCEVVIDAGPIMQPAAVLAIAEERIGRASQLAQQAGDQDVENMATT